MSPKKTIKFNKLYYSPFIALQVSMSTDEILGTDSILSGATSRALSAACRRWSGIGLLWCTWAHTWAASSSLAVTISVMIIDHGDGDGLEVD